MLGLKWGLGAREGGRGVWPTFTSKDEKRCFMVAIAAGRCIGTMVWSVRTCVEVREGYKKLR